MAKKGEQALTKTSRATKFKAGVRGFTLVEILVTIGLIALVSAVAIPSLTFIMKTSTDTFARQVSELLKEARDRALLTGNIVRLHVDMEKQEYYLEEAPSSVLLPSAAELEKKKEEKKDDKDNKAAESDGFRLLREITKDKKRMPTNLKISEVITPRNKKPLTEGDAFIYFFPRGSADNSALHIEDEDGSKVSIIVEPVTGLSKFRPGFITSEGAE